MLLSSGSCGSQYQISHVETCGTRRAQGALVFGPSTTRFRDDMAVGPGLALLDLTGRGVDRPLRALLPDYPASVDAVVLLEKLPDVLKDQPPASFGDGTGV